MSSTARRNEVIQPRSMKTTNTAATPAIVIATPASVATTKPCASVGAGIDKTEVVQNDQIGLLIARDDRKGADENAPAIIDDGGEAFGLRPGHLVAREGRRHQFGGTYQSAGLVAQANGQNTIVQRDILEYER